MKQISVGILGLGRSGWGIHAAGLSELPEHYVVSAVADGLPERLAEAQDKFGCATYADPAELIAHAACDLIVVATPSHTHAALGLQALQSGKHVVVEKPMGTVEEIDQLERAAQQAGRVVTAFQNQRLEPSFLAVREVLASGRIGEVVLVRRTGHRFQRRTDWQTLRSHGGGELPNTTLHFLDQLLTLIPEDTPLQVLADLRQLNSAGDAEDHVKLTLRPDHGPVLDLETSMAIATPQDSWFVVGSAGTITGSTQELTVTWTDLDALPAVEASPDAAAGRQYGNGEQYTWQTETIAVGPATRRTFLYYQKLYQTLVDGAELFVTPSSVRRVSHIVAQARTLSNFP